MNKKIVFSLALLSAFSYVSADTRTPLQIGIAENDDHQKHLDKCFNLVPSNRTVDGLNDCTKLRKFNDDIYVHCKAKSDVGLTEHSSYFHLINILTQKGDVYKNPEKVRYEALRQCEVTYYDSRMYSAYKLAKKYSTNGDATSFIDSYRKNVIEKELNKTTNEVCKRVLQAELDYVVNHSKDSLDDIDFAPYYAAIGYDTPTVQNLTNSKEYKIGNVDLKSNLTHNKKKMIQDFYKEFKVNTTGRVIVSSSPTVINGQYLVYLLDQNDFATSNGWIYKNFSNIVGDKTNASDIEGMRGCSSLSNDSLNLYTIKSSDVNKLIFINEKYNNEVVLGVCDVYNKYLSLNINPDSFVKARALEAIILKNSKIKPYDYGDFLADYNDKGNGNRVNDYAGGVSKCYNYDLENHNSNYSRARFLDWKGELDFRKDDAKAIARKNYIFSIHKPNGNHGGIFNSEGSEYNFSVNVRPSLKYLSNRNENNTSIDNLSVKFIPDADYYQITDEANKSGKKDNIPLKVTNLNDVYIALNNSKTKFNASDRLADNISVKYYLTKFKITKQQIANENGAIDGKEEEISDDNSKYELVLKDNINGEFGLRFTEDTFMNLARFSKEELKKELDKGNVYSLKFTPLEIMEHIEETNKVEKCPEISGVCKIVDDTRKYYRPIFQASGVDIVKGAPKGSVEIILGNTKMPNTTFGTAYNSIDNDKVIVNNKISSNTKVANKIYTRTNKQDIYIGFTKDNNKPLYNQYIKFYNGSKELEADVYNSKQKASKVITECQGYYPIDNKMVLHLKKMDIGQDYKLSYKIAEYDTRFNSCFELGEVESNAFSIRPESVEYEVNGKDSFDKKAGKNDDNYTDNNVVINSDIKDDRFGVGIAELRVNDSKNKEYVFNLEDKNTTQLNDPKNKTFVDFDKDGNFAIKTIFPMVTDAKIALAESKFTINDYENGLCEDTKRAVSVSEANKINKNGKIYCQTPGNEIKVKFTASQSLSFEKDAANKEIKAGVTNTNFINYVPFSDLDGERLRIPLQIANTNNGSYFYKKYDSNTVEAELNLIYKTEPKDLSKVIINVVSDLNPKKINQNKYELSGLNDKFNDKLTALNIADKLSAYNDADFDAKNFAKLEYKIGYPKTVGGKPNLVREFIISNADSKITFANGSEEPKNSILDNSYKFAYTGLFFKDINSDKTKGASSYEIKAKNAGLLKYVENKGFEKIDDKNVDDFEKLYNNAIGSFTLISDYSKEALDKNNYKIPAKLSDNQYVKDTIRFKIEDSAYKYLDSFSTFTIEFVK